jgi:ketosteroid isomerase-like protein
MRSNMVWVGVGAALMGLAPPLFAHNPATAVAHANKLPAAARGAAATVDAFHAALHRGDTKSAAALLANDAVIFESGGVERNKAEYSAHHLLVDAEFSSAVQSVVIYRTGNADGMHAWIASEGRTTGTFRGKSLDLLTTETMLLRWSGGAWKIVHIHWSSEVKR